MTSTARKVLDAALALDEDERLELAAELMASVGGASDPDWEQAWAAELNRRVASTEPGVAETWDQVRRRLFPKLGPRLLRNGARGVG